MESDTEQPTFDEEVPLFDEPAKLPKAIRKLRVEPRQSDCCQDAEGWGLHRPSRFPITMESWDRYLPLPEPREVNRSGIKSYDTIVNRKARRPHWILARKMLESFPNDFAAGSVALSPEEWRLLYFIGRYTISRLGDPSFDSVQVMSEDFEQRIRNHDVPAALIGRIGSIERVSLHLEWDVRSMTPDIGNAVWCILSVARGACFELNEVVQVPWWKVWWLDRYLSSIR